jgi:hypothetical protein
MIKEILKAKTRRNGNRVICICDNCKVLFKEGKIVFIDGKYYLK